MEVWHSIECQRRRTQPVEILYAAWPMFMTIDPSLGGPLLEPLLSAQDTPAYMLPYAMTDLGMFLMYWCIFLRTHVSQELHIPMSLRATILTTRVLSRAVT